MPKNAATDVLQERTSKQKGSKGLRKRLGRRIKKALSPRRKSKSHLTVSSDLASNTSDLSKMNVRSQTSRAPKLELLDSMTMYLKVSLRDEEKLTFCVGGNNDENESRKVVLTNKELLQMANTGRQFQPTIISKEKRETLHGLWMEVTSEISLKEMEMMLQNNSVPESESDSPPTLLVLAKHASLIPISILTAAIISIFTMDGSLLHDFLLSSSNSILYLKITIWCSFAAFIAVTIALREIISLRQNINTVTKDHNPVVELKIVMEKWSSERPRLVASSVSDMSNSQQTETTLHDESRKEEATSNGTLKKSVSDISSKVADTVEAGIDYPVRFLRAAKGDPIHGRERFEATMKWREEERMDSILDEPFIYFELVKKYYPHYYHLRGKNNEPVYYESPAKFKVKPLKAAGMTMEDLLRYYALVTEYMWKRIEPSEEGKSIYVIDLDGIRLMDFVGDVVDFVKKTSSFTSAHYPERSGTIFVINVPSWFNIIWKVVSPMADEVTRQKIRILRGKNNILNDLMTRVDVENIPSNYGGKSMALGESPEEKMFAEDMRKNLQRANLSVAK